MTDRGLLELAAKAAGIDGEWSERRIGRIGKFGVIEYSKRGGIATWNPLKDDGDALRLAVKLALGINVLETDVRVATPYGAQCIVEVFYHGEDPLAQTRRAIVRAAAEIGAKHGAS